MLFHRERALDYMQAYALDALVATSPVNITYFTDYSCWIDPLFKEFMMVPGASSNLAQAYAVFPAAGDPALVVNPLFAVNAADLWVKDLHVFGSAGLDGSLGKGEIPDALQRFDALLHPHHAGVSSTDALLSILADRGLTRARIGLEAEGLPPGRMDAIAASLPAAQIKDCSSLIRLVRMVKTWDEIGRLTRSAQINERAALASLGQARPGQPLRQLAEVYRAGAAAQGADFDHFAFGVRGLGIATETGYALSGDDVLYVDFGCVYRGCFSDSGTTLALRALTGELNRRHVALHAAVEAGAHTLRPGVRASSVAAAMSAELRARGVSGSFPHGHGLGLEVRDYPILVADNGLRIRDGCVDEPSDLRLEADMVLNLEAPLFMPGIGSLHVEQSFVVTDGGSRPLVPQQRARPLRGAA